MRTDVRLRTLHSTGPGYATKGEAPQALVDDYPGLELEDIRACLAYAHAVIANDSLDAIRLTES